jgi:hypothetical protein
MTSTPYDINTDEGKAILPEFPEAALHVAVSVVNAWFAASRPGKKSAGSWRAWSSLAPLGTCPCWASRITCPAIPRFCGTVTVYTVPLENPLLHSGFTAYNPAQQRYPFALHLASDHYHPKDNRWQRSLRQAMEMFPSPSFEVRAPETSHIHTHGLVSFMPSHTPVILACHVNLPIVQQFVARPCTITPPNFASQPACRILWHRMP